MSTGSGIVGGFWLNEKKLGVQYAPGLGGCSVTKVNSSSAGASLGLATTDRIVGVGHSAGNGLFAGNAWVEASELEGLLSQAGRPCFVSFKSSRPQATANAQACEEAWSAILRFIRSSPERAKEMGQLFTSWDEDGSGKLSIDELGRALVSFGVSLGPKELVAFKNSVDSNHDNQITLDEFTKAVVSRHQLAAQSQNNGSKSNTTSSSRRRSSHRNQSAHSADHLADAAAPSSSSPSSSSQANNNSSSSGSNSNNAQESKQEAQNPEEEGKGGEEDGNEFEDEEDELEEGEEQGISGVSMGAPAPALKSYSERRQEPLTAAWLKVLGYLRANSENAKEVKKLFLELEGDRKRVWDEQQHAHGGRGGNGGGTVGCFGSGLGMKKKKKKGPAPGVPVLQLGVGLRKLGVNFSDDELAAFFTGCDQNGDGLLTMEEFTVSVAKQKVEEQKELRNESVWKRLQLYLHQHGDIGHATLNRVFKVYARQPNPSPNPTDQYAVAAFAAYQKAQVKADAHYATAAKSLLVQSSSSSVPFMSSNKGDDEDKAKMRAKKAKEQEQEKVKKEKEAAAVAARQAYHPPLPPVGRMTSVDFLKALYVIGAGPQGGNREWPPEVAAAFTAKCDECFLEGSLSQQDVYAALQVLPPLHSDDIADDDANNINSSNGPAPALPARTGNNSPQPHSAPPPAPAANNTNRRRPPRALAPPRSDNNGSDNSSFSSSSSSSSSVSSSSSSSDGSSSASSSANPTPTRRRPPSATAAAAMREAAVTNNNSEGGGGGGLQRQSSSLSSSSSFSSTAQVKYEVGDEVEMRDGNGYDWVKGVVKVAGVTNTDLSRAPQIARVGWPQAYTWEQVRPYGTNHRGGVAVGPIEAEGAEATALEKSFEDAASNSNKVDNGDGDEATSSTDQKAVALDSALRKLLAFLQADTGNATALTTVFMRHERAEQKRRTKEGTSASTAASGLDMTVLVAEFKTLGVGLSPQESEAFLESFDANGDGRMSISEFTQVIAAAKRKETKTK